MLLHCLKHPLVSAEPGSGDQWGPCIAYYDYRPLKLNIEVHPELNQYKGLNFINRNTKRRLFLVICVASVSLVPYFRKWR